MIEPFDEIMTKSTGTETRELDPKTLSAIHRAAAKRKDASARILATYNNEPPYTVEELLAADARMELRKALAASARMSFVSEIFKQAKVPVLWSPELERRAVLLTALERLEELEKKVTGHIKEARDYIQRAIDNK